MIFGSRSNINPLRRVQLVPPGRWAKEALLEAGWGRISTTEMHRQFNAYVKLLYSRGVDVTLTDPAENPDGIYG